MYTYKAKVIRVVDGDTLDLEIDLGFKITLHERIRLSGVNTPETRTRDKKEKEAGLKAKQYVCDMVSGKSIEIETAKQGKFGRYLATIYYGTKKINLNKELIKKGYAREYFGGKR